MRQFMFDLETLDVESTAVVLSAAIIEFKLDEKPTYSQLLDRSMFVKFNVEHQIKQLKRTCDKDTMEWWAKQCKMVKSKSLIPGIYDLLPEQGLDILRSYAHLDPAANKNRDVTIWARGALDQLCIDSLCKAAGQDILVPYSNWRDVRTMIDCTKNTAGGGYCMVPGFDRGIVMKHDPVHDCAYDILMMLMGD